METTHHFDHIRINTRQYKQILEISLPLDKLKKECKDVKILWASSAARKGKFKSSINMVAPTNDFFKILQTYELALGFYKISKVEIAKDICHSDLLEAISAFDKTQKDLSKKCSTGLLIYDQRKNKKPVKIENGLWGEKTIYLGGRSFMIRIYNRDSKITGEPCLHMEFVVQSASNIKKKTGIEFIGDFIDYDIEKRFELLEDRFLDNSQIDNQKLGKWLSNRTRRRKFTKREYMSIGVYAQTFRDAYEIEKFADLKYYFGKLKAEIGKRRGRKSKEDKRIRGMKYNYFCKKVG